MSDDKNDKIDFDFSKFKRLFSNTKALSIILTVLLILIPVVLTVYVRVLPEYLPQTDAWAQNSVDSYFRNQIATSVNQQYPNLPQANKDQLINQQVEQFKQTNKDQIAQQIKGTSDFFKTGFRYEENGYTYTFLGDLDSYAYLRQARNLAEKGMICDEIKNGQCWDNHMYAPLGTGTGPSMHPYGIYYLYKVLHTFSVRVNLMLASFYLPTILAVIAAIAAFFIGKRIMNEVAGFFAAMFIALSPMLVSRTLGSDTDIWNIMFPLVILWLFLEAFEAKSVAKNIIFASIAGLMAGLFSFAWTGWWYIFLFILAGLIGYIVLDLVRTFIHHKKIFTKNFTGSMKNALIVLACFIVSTAIFVSLISGFSDFINVFFSPFNYVSSFKAAAHADLWPNVYTTVAELNEANLSGVVSQTAFGINTFFALALLGTVLTLVKRKPDLKDYLLIGGSILVFVFLVSKTGLALSNMMFLGLLILPVVAGVLLFLTRKEEHEHVDIKLALLLTIWFVGMIFASTKGVRFILLLIPAFSVAIGVAIGYLYQYFSRMLKEELHVNDIISKIVVFLVLSSILILPIQAGIATGSSFTPSMTKGWWDSLTKINQESKPDAIINSWWDFGHWFKYVADRRVTLDGASQNHPDAHWLGKILQTSNENESVAILRMLDCGSNSAFDEINKKYSDTEKSQNILSELILMNKNDAEKYLKKLQYTDSEIKPILGFTHCNPPEDYFITSEDMVGKAGVWAHFGLWDFDRAFMVNEVKPSTLEKGIQLLKERFNYTEEQSTSIYYELQSLQTDREQNDWISGWPNYFTADWTGCQEARKNETDENNKTVEKKALICPLNRVVSQDANSKTAIDGIIINLDDPAQSTMVVSAYDNTGFKRGTGAAKPAGFVIYDSEAKNNIKRYKVENSTFPFDVVIDLANARVLVTDPQLSESLFTKLFYLDGVYNSRFEKFSDVTDITGQRIIVWKVKW